MDTALSLPTRVEQMQALTALARLLSSPHEHGEGQPARQPLVKRVHAVRRDLFMAAKSDPTERMSLEDIAVATGMSKAAVYQVMLSAEQKAAAKKS